MSRSHRFLVPLVAAALLAAAARADRIAALKRKRELRAARERVLSRRPEHIPDFLGPSLDPDSLRKDLADVGAMDALELKKGEWRVLRAGEHARHLTWSGDGRALGWVDTASSEVRVWHFGSEPISKPMKGGGGGIWVDYLTLDEEGTQGVLGLHRFAMQAGEDGEPRLYDKLTHHIFAAAGPARVIAGSKPSEHLRHSRAAYVGEKLLLLESKLAEEPQLAPWSYPAELDALWLHPDFETPAADMDKRGVSYTLTDHVPSRAATPTWAPLKQRIYLGMGVGIEGQSDRLPRFVIRGLPVNGSFPGAFAVLGIEGNLEFDVPGAPLSLSAAPDASLFVYTHGAAGVLGERAGVPGVLPADDGYFARPSKGIWFLRPGRDPVLVPHPHDAPCYEVAWRPDGLEVAVATDLDEDGVVDVAVYDLTERLRAHHHRNHMLAQVRTEAEKQKAAEAAAAAAEARKKQAEAERRAEQARKLAARKAADEEAAAARMAARKQAEAAAAAARAKARARSRQEELEQVLAAARSGETGTDPARVKALLDGGKLSAEQRQLLTGYRHFLDGTGKLEARKIGPGLAALARSVESWPEGANPAYSRLAGECVKRKLYSDGKRYIDQWIQRGGGDPAVTQKIQLASGAGKHAEAVALARTLVKRNSFSAPEKILLGDTLMAAGKPAEALASYREAKTLAPDQVGLDTKIFEAESNQMLGSSQ